MIKGREFVCEYRTRKVIFKAENRIQQFRGIYFCNPGLSSIRQDDQIPLVFVVIIRPNVSRLVPGQNFGLQFREREGFVSCEAPPATKTITEFITEILRANPNSNQSEIVRQARARGSRRGDIELCLKDGDWSRRPGPKNSTLFDLPENERDGDETH